jgi:hypothetical protein
MDSVAPGVAKLCGEDIETSLGRCGSTNGDKGQHESADAAGAGQLERNEHIFHCF